MHLYIIRRGTHGKLITQKGSDQSPVVTDWVTRKSLTFTEFVIDPVWYHNNRGKMPISPTLEQLAQRGFAVYGGESGGVLTAKYLLAVPYESVRVA